MAQAVFSGPLISLGPLTGGQRGGQPIEYSDEIGPSLLWNGNGLPLAGTLGSKDRKGQGAIRAAFLSDVICVCNSVLAAGGVALTAAANAVSGATLALATATIAGLAAGVPVYATGGALVNGVVVDPGFATVSTSSASANVTVAANDSWRFIPGQWYSFNGAGVGGSTLFARVVSIAGTAMVISTNALATSALVQVAHVAGNPNSYGWAPVAYSSSMPAGTGRFINPDCSASRGVGILAVAGSTGGVILITGLDQFLQLQTEAITVPAGAGTTYSKKSLKVLISAVPQFADAHAYQVVTGDLIGFPVAYVAGGFFPSANLNGTAYTTSVYQFADLTNPATSTTGDPRGGMQLSAKGPIGGASGTGPNGTARVQILQQLNPAQVFLASAVNTAVLYGVQPA